MSRFARFILELARIILILGIIIGVLTNIFTVTLNRFNIEPTDSLLVAFQCVIIIAYAIWYYKRGQYRGWHGTSKNV